MGIIQTETGSSQDAGQEIYRAPETAREERASRDTTEAERTTARAITGGSSVEAIGGVAAIVLAIIGLAGFLPIYMASIATIAIGAALMFEGAAIFARWKALTRAEPRLRGGVGTEVFGGAAGIVLGILALVGVAPNILLPVAAIVFGGSLILGGSVEAEAADAISYRDPRRAHLFHETAQASGGVMVLVGIGAAVLGILGVLTVGPVLTLTMVSMLAIGGAVLVGASELVARFSQRLST
jgi:hypothetical protein